VTLRARCLAALSRRAFCDWENVFRLILGVLDEAEVVIMFLNVEPDQ